MRRRNTWEPDEDPDAWKGDDEGGEPDGDESQPEACNVCGKPALVGVTTDKGPVCKRHALAHMDVPVGEEEIERSCQSCGRVLRDPNDAAYIEKVGFFHPKCLKEKIKSGGECPKCGLKLNSWGDCSSCWGGVAKWIEQAMKDARSVMGAEGRRLCAMCLRHNRSIGPGYPFYAVEPRTATQTCSECFAAVCDEHAAHLPKDNVLGLSTTDVYCGGLPYGPGTTTCIGKLESSLECSVEGCRADRDNQNYDALTEAKKCEKCGNWMCGRDHEHCPDCEGVPCDECRELTPKEDLHRFEESAYKIKELCETCLSEAESEEQESSWGNWLGGDYKSSLEKRFAAEGLDLQLDDVDDLEELFKFVQERCGIYWSGTEIDWRAVVMCTSVADILSLKGAELEGSPVSPNAAFSRRVVNALARVDELTADGESEGNRSWRKLEARLEANKKSLGRRLGTRHGRAQVRESLRRTMRSGGGLWATPEQRRSVKALPRTVAGMRQLAGIADKDRRSDIMSAARRERNPKRRLDDKRNYLSHGFYMIDEEDAKRLAREARNSVPARERLTHLRAPGDRTMLPSAGYELRVEYDGKLWWLARTPHQGRMVWSIREN